MLPHVANETAAPQGAGSPQLASQKHLALNRPVANGKSLDTLWIVR
jgi:hypothetical protein